MLGSHHILVAGTKDLIHLGYRFGTVCHCANGLNTAYLVDLADACNTGSHQNGGMNLAFLVGRGAEHNLLTACNFGRCCQHQDCREEWGCTSWNIETYPFYRYALLPADDTLLGLYFLAYEAL